jgi:enoyl-CoA hydratase
MDYKTLDCQLEDGIYIITINRPEKLNALNKDVFTDIAAAVEEVERNAAIKSALITGAGDKAFVAGADISEFGGLTLEQAKALSKRGQDIFFSIENCSKPVVAAVNGFALGGGCELAMACHFRVASSNAKFGQPEVNLGLIPGYGGTQRLTQLVGKGKSMELHMTGGMLSAEDALQWGLVNYVTAPEELLATTKKLLAQIQTKAPVAISKVIECVNVAAASDSSLNEGVSGYEREVEAFGECFSTDDMKEGTTAFMEKRKAVFVGK